MALRVASEYRFLCLALHVPPATEKDTTSRWLSSHPISPSLIDRSTWKEVVRFVKVSLLRFYAVKILHLFLYLTHIRGFWFCKG